MYKLFISVCSICLLTLGATAQSSDSTTHNVNPDWVVPAQSQQRYNSTTTTQNTTKPWKDRLKYGGNLWLSVFYGSAYIDVEPMVGYRLNEKGTTVGVGLNMIYASSSGVPNSGSFDYGARFFVQQPIFNMFFLQAEVETMNAKGGRFIDYSTDPLKRKWEAYPQIGLGFYPSKMRGGNNGVDRGGNYYMALFYNLGYPNSGYYGSTNLGGGLTLRIGYF